MVSFQVKTSDLVCCRSILIFSMLQDKTAVTATGLHLYWALNFNRSWSNFTNTFVISLILWNQCSRKFWHTVNWYGAMRKCFPNTSQTSKDPHSNLMILGFTGLNKRQWCYQSKMSTWVYRKKQLLKHSQKSPWQDFCRWFWTDFNYLPQSNVLTSEQN